MSGRKSRDKGARFEREVLAYFRARGFTVMRSRQFKLGGSLEPDVLAAMAGAVLKIECKSRKDLPSKAHRDALAQAIATLGDGTPIALIKSPGKPILDAIVELRLSDFIEVLCKARE